MLLNQIKQGKSCICTRVDTLFCLNTLYYVRYDVDLCTGAGGCGSGGNCTTVYSTSDKIGELAISCDGDISKVS